MITCKLWCRKMDGNLACWNAGDFSKSPTEIDLYRLHYFGEQQASQELGVFRLPLLISIEGKIEPELNSKDAA